MLEDEQIRKPAPSPLLAALHEGDTDRAILAVQDGVDVALVDPRPLIGDNQTALHLAANQNNIPVMSVLLAQGAKVDAITTHGQTPLWLAANAGHGEAVRLLLQAGADPNIKSVEGYSPLSRVPGANDTVMNLLRSYGAEF